MPTRLIATADDFGLDASVNEAVETAHSRGILTGASLMVGAPATADAVERARRLPSLRVGLHLVLVDGVPLLPAKEIPDLTGADGSLDSHLFRAGVAYFFRPRVRRQLRREIQAQFEAFSATGLALDHVNTHHHMHLHPTVAGLIVEIGKPFGLAAVRMPAEPAEPLRRAFMSKSPGGSSRLLSPWLHLLRARLHRHGLVTNDNVFGLAWPGGVTESRLLSLLPHLPEGVNEIYFHPSMPASVPERRSDADGAAELAALISNAVRNAIAERGIQMTSYGDLVAGNRAGEPQLV